MKHICVPSLFLVFVSLSTATQIRRKMNEHEVVPDVIDEAPSALVAVNYRDDCSTVELGNELTPTQVQNAPSVNWKADTATYYTLLMTDPDAPSRLDPTFRELHHWLVGNIPGNDITKGDTFSEYIGAGPPLGSGLHRYVFLIFKQPGKIQFDEPFLPGTSIDGRPNFSTRNFASKYELQLEAGNFFQAQYDAFVDQRFND